MSFYRSTSHAKRKKVPTYRKGKGARRKAVWARGVRALLAAAIASPFCLSGISPSVVFAQGDPAQVAVVEIPYAYSGEHANDLVKLLENGNTTIDQGGSYCLNGDVRLSSPLIVSAPEGSSVAIDLNGHNITVAGEVSCAVSLDESKGSVCIFDSQAAGGSAADAPKASITLLADNAQETVSAIRINQQGQRSADATVDVRGIAIRSAVRSIATPLGVSKAVSVYDVYGGKTGDAAKSSCSMPASFNNCWFCSVMANQEVVSNNDYAWLEMGEQQGVSTANQGVTCGICMDGQQVTLSGTCIWDLVGDEGTCGLYSFKPKSFTFSEDFSCPEETSAYVFGAAGGTVLGSCATELQAVSLSGKLVDAAQSNATFEPDGTNLVYTVNASEDAAAQGSTDLSTMSIPDGDAAASSSEVKSLNELWTDTSSAYTIREAGTYKLDSDLSVTKTASLSINADGLDVIIDLNGHTFNSSLYNSTAYSVRVVKAASVTIKNGTMNCSNNLAYSAVRIQSSTVNVTVSNLKINCVPSDEFRDIDPANVYAIEASGGTVSVDGCEFCVDLSNQTVITSYRKELPENPSCIYSASDSSLKSLTVTNTKMTTKATPSMLDQRHQTDTYWGLGVNSFGMLIEKASPVTVNGCTFVAFSPHGSAFGVGAKSMTMTGTNTVYANGEAKAIGVQSLKQQGVTLNGKLVSGFAGLASPKVSTALYSSIDEGFVIGSDFSGSDLGVLQGGEGVENDVGAVVASFDNTVSDSMKNSIAASFTNAFGADAPTKLAVSSNELVFALEDANAVAEVVHADGTTSRYAYPTSAAANSKTGETIRLLKDAERISFEDDASGKSVTLDLNGHTIGSISHADASELTVKSLVSVTGVDSSAYEEEAVVQSGSGAMTLEGVRIVNRSAYRACTGLSVAGSGALTAAGCDISAASQTNTTTAVNVSSKATGGVTLQGCSIEADTQAEALAAYGVRDQASEGWLSIVDTPISVSTVEGVAGGVSTSCVTSVTGSEALGEQITVTTSNASNQAWCIAGDDATADIAVSNCALKVSAASGVDTSSSAYWCLTSGKAGSEKAVGWTLDGACSFDSCNNTDLLQQDKSIQLGTSFALSDGDVISIRSNELEGNVFAVCQGVSATAFANCFSVLDGSFYTGDWEASFSPDDQSKLVWIHDYVAKNEATNAFYSSLQDAVADAQAGNTITLVGDVNSTYPIEVEKSLVIDLNGHNASINSVWRGSLAAIACAGNSDLRIEDSAQQKGTLDLKVGSSDDSSKSGVSGYRGFSVTAGNLSFQGANAKVSYAGSYTGNAAFSLYGVALEGNSSCLLEDGASLTVASMTEGNAKGALYAYGIHAFGPQRITVDESSAILVDEQCESYYSNDLTAVSYAKASVTGIGFEQISPREGTALYQEILEKFQNTAKFDKEASTDSLSSYTLGSRIYYSTEMHLDDGTMVWAYSDPVPLGKEIMDYCKPSLIFVQSRYTFEPSAKGISTADGSGASGTVQGSVAVNAPHGEALALDLEGSGSWEVSNAHLSVTSSQSTFLRMDTSQRIDLRNYLDVDITSDKLFFYPINAYAYEVSHAKPRAYGVYASSTTSLKIDGTFETNVEGADPADIVSGDFEVGSSFSPAAGSKVTVGSFTGENEEGVQFAHSSSSINTNWFGDAYGEFSAELKGQNVLVWGGNCTVAFYNSNSLVAQNEGLHYGDRAPVPDKQLMYRADSISKRHEFLGWSTDPDATEAQIPADTESVPVETSCDYYAVYRDVPLSVQVTFSNLREDNGEAKESVSFACDVNATLGECAQGSVPAQGDYVIGDTTYKFVGWKLGKMGTYDPQDLLTDLVLDYNVDGVTTGAVSFDAVYICVRPGQHLVRFKIDDTVVPGVFNDGAIPSYQDALGIEAVVPTKVNTETGHSYIFQGWHSGYVAGDSAQGSSVDYEKGASLPAVTSDAEYTACYEDQLSNSYAQVKYWRQKESGYLYTTSDTITTLYGTDLIDELNKLVKVGDTFSQDGTEYTFLGWSTRETDVGPLYTTSVPSVQTYSLDDAAVNYYGIYARSEQKITVTFHDGDAVYATSEDCPASTTVKDALAVGNKTEPEDKSSAEVFSGWATTANASKSDVNSTDAVGNLSGGAYTLDLYAVYSEGFKPAVDFYDSDHETKLGSVSTYANTTTAASGYSVANPSSEGNYFKRWVTASGETFAQDSTIVTSNMRVFAEYEELYTDISDNVVADVSIEKTSFTGDEGVGKASVAFMFSTTANACDTIVNTAKANGDVLIGDAAYRGYFSATGSPVSRATDFGTVTISLPKGTVSSNASLCIYWLDSNGAALRTGITQPKNGYLTFSLTSYTLPTSTGNIVVAQTSAVRSATLDKSDGNGGSSKTSSSLSSSSSGTTLNSSTSTLPGASNATLPSNSSAATASSSKDSSALKSSTDSAVATDDVANEEDTQADTTDVVNGAEEISQEDLSKAYANIVGNPLVWLLFILLLGMLGTLAWRLLVGRKQSEEDEEEAGWSDAKSSDAPQEASDEGISAGGILL